MGRLRWNAVATGFPETDAERVFSRRRSVGQAETEDRALAGGHTPAQSTFGTSQMYNRKGRACGQTRNNVLSLPEVERTHVYRRRTAASDN